MRSDFCWKISLAVGGIDCKGTREEEYRSARRLLQGSVGKTGERIRMQSGAGWRAVRCGCILKAEMTDYS